MKAERKRKADKHVRTDTEAPRQTDACLKTSSLISAAKQAVN